MIINREWAMPNKETFSIPPIKKVIEKYKIGGIVIDPFARNSNIATYTNDLDPNTSAHYHLDALEFLQRFDSNSVNTVLFDPPYSPRQVSECYTQLGKTVNMQTTQSKFWGDLKKEISRITVQGGIVITCGWNSGGIGKSNGFEIQEILLVAHGGWHNDTIVTVEKKI